MDRLRMTKEHMEILQAIHLMVDFLDFREPGVKMSNNEDEMSDEDEIRFESITRATVVHARRQTNEAAHRLARYALSSLRVFLVRGTPRYSSCYFVI
ncbi:hypothetical protein C1H46_038785 [Malus baccata]|uniref:Uncharacterized protein n=1 Tax=Malus baccata TaxID=106549 RepID=A0A540KN80_MALBA|nr:hypothetical protein C1H46_038785 [Malus baccata]